MDKQARIYVAGHQGMVGSAIVRLLQSQGYTNIILKSRTELDLRDGEQAAQFFQSIKPEYVFLCAARVGGILANSCYPADFIYDNLAIQNNVIHLCYEAKVTKLLFLGSSCIYPRDCPQPIREEYLLSGPLEPTNEWYAIAKIAGIKL
jgi:GDP-L-fucose synthase